MFVIVNNTASTIGPYGSQGTTIASGGSFTVNNPVNSYASDPNLLSDVLTQVATIQVGGTNLPANTASSFLEGIDSKNLNSYKNITGNQTVTVKSGGGVLNGIIIGNDSTEGTITIYDNTAASGTIISSMQIGSPAGGLLSTSGIPMPLIRSDLAIEFATGLTVVTAGSSSNNVTILYR